MSRRPIAILLCLALGLWSSLAAEQVCLCLGDAPALQAEQAACPDCDGGDLPVAPCCGDEDCCIVVGEMPDATEPGLPTFGGPVALPLAVPPSMRKLPVPREGAVRPDSREPRRPPSRIRFGVWRL